MKKITKIKRNVKALSPVISALLMIAITVIASLVAYAWIAGYLNSTTNRTSKAILIQSAVLNSATNSLTVYVQNVGQGVVEFGSDSLYIDGKLLSLNSPVLLHGATFELPEGQTQPLIVDYSGSNKQIEIKVVTNDGSFSQLAIKPNYVSTLSSSFYTLSNPWSTVDGDPANMHTFQPVHDSKIIQVDMSVDGSTWKYLAYASSPWGNEIYLYYTNDTSGAWTPYSANPVIGPSPPPQNFYRWPSVTYSGGVFHMFLSNVDGGWGLEHWESTDGIHFVKQEVIKTNSLSEGQYFCWNPFIWQNPNDGKWYLYTHDYQQSPYYEYVTVRSADTIAGLVTATDYTLLKKSCSFGSPTIMYYKGQYWLLYEQFNWATNKWETFACYSTSPDSGFVESKDSPILTNNEACGIVLFGPNANRVYLFVTIMREDNVWYQETRDVIIS